MLVGLATRACAQTRSIVDLGRAEGVGSMAISESDRVVFGGQGLSPEPRGLISTPWFSRAGGNSNFALHDISNANAVVGRNCVAGGWRGFVWQDGERTHLPSAGNGALHGRANGIDDSGQVVGSAGDYATIGRPMPRGATASPPWAGTGITRARASAPARECSSTRLAPG